MGSSRRLFKLHLHLSISTALMRPRRPKQYCLQLDIALWCEIQIEHSIWDESLLLSNCTCSLEYSSLSALAGLSYHICGKLEVAFKASPSSQHQHCTDEAQKAEKSLQLTRIFVEYQPEDFFVKPLWIWVRLCGHLSVFLFLLPFRFTLLLFWWCSALSPLLGLTFQLCLLV